MDNGGGRPYKRHARVLYGFFSTALSALSHVRPLFLLALRVLTHRKQQVTGRILPMNARIGRPEQAALGRDVLAELIAHSTAIGAMNECMCRAVGGCTDYPKDIGCLVLGSGALALHPGLGRSVTRQEAMAAVDRALACGLVPMVIHLKSDALLWSLDHKKMLTVCFCCPCHCLIRQAMGKNGSGAARHVTGLPGVAVSLDAAKCTGCGRCAAACFTGALSIENGKAAIDGARCVACGRCTMACRSGALAVDADPGYDAGPVLREFEQRMDGNSVFIETDK